MCLVAVRVLVVVGMRILAHLVWCFVSYFIIIAPFHLVVIDVLYSLLRFLRFHFWVYIFIFLLIWFVALMCLFGSLMLAVVDVVVVLWRCGVECVCVLGVFGRSDVLLLYVVRMDARLSCWQAIMVMSISLACWWASTPQTSRFKKM